MDRDETTETANLLDRENRLIADVLSHFRSLVILATEPVNKTASAGQAAYSSMAMEIETKGLIKATEDLLQLTRLLRELWVVGPLRKPGEGVAEVEQSIDTEVQDVVSLLNKLREQSRRQMIEDGGGHGNYVVTSPTEEPADEGNAQWPRGS
ncbi:hypothetical protein VTK73DRAFT_1518 [Phialemonium thermophilum]|uniref:Mediator of RNA polymerase II transcription subunit 22 n=1 Tax=Phialemonium thermophilum TaxID=223376 RepID=A0ABR3X944_9PEZI